MAMNFDASNYSKILWPLFLQLLKLTDLNQDTGDCHDSSLQSQLEASLTLIRTDCLTKVILVRSH